MNRYSLAQCGRESMTTSGLSDLPCTTDPPGSSVYWLSAGCCKKIRQSKRCRSVLTLNFTSRRPIFWKSFTMIHSQSNGVVKDLHTLNLWLHFPHEMFATFLIHRDQWPGFLHHPMYHQLSHVLYFKEYVEHICLSHLLIWCSDQLFDDVVISGLHSLERVVSFVSTPLSEWLVMSHVDFFSSQHAGCTNRCLVRHLYSSLMISAIITLVSIAMLLIKVL